MLKFTTKRNASGTRYTLRINPELKTFHRDYNDSWNYSDFITITKTDREKLINQLIESGYTEN